jgi:lipoate-protein ligase A
MTVPRLRLLPFAEGRGAWNMAADEALLESAAEGVATLRCYGWTTPTLSLGYFQRAADRLADPLLAGLPFVRRPSGGGALVHHHEVTYCLALTGGEPWQRPGESWARRLHNLLQRALAVLGVLTELCPPDGERGRGDFLCFRHITPDDLLLGPHKIAGSAQRRPRGALLQHGGILLARSAHTPALPGIAELTGRRLSTLDVAAALAEQFVHGVGWAVEPGDWDGAEISRAAELEATRYTAASWNEKR